MLHPDNGTMAMSVHKPLVRAARSIFEFSDIARDAGRAGQALEAPKINRCEEY
jgi:hypothetical protein